MALMLTALAAMLWTAPKTASAAWPQSAPIKTLDSAPQNRADPLLAEARALADKGMASEAEQRVRQYLAMHPDSSNAHFLLGYILFREIQEQAAGNENASLSDSAPMALSGSASRQPSATASLGDKGATSEANYRNTKTKASLAEFTEGAKYHPPSAFDLKIVAFDYVLLDDYVDADKWLTKMLQWTPADAEGWYYLGRTKYNENRFDEAVHAFQQTLTLDPHRSTPSVLHPQSRMFLLGFEGRSCLSSHQLESSIFGILFECLEVGSAFGSIPETQFNLSNR